MVDSEGEAARETRGASQTVTSTDRELVRRALQGEAESFKALVQRHAAPLWGTLSARVRDVEDARDILQETWVRAYERLGTLREPNRLRAWLLSIALNLARSRGRRIEREVPLEAVIGEGAEPAAPAAHDPFDLAERDERLRRELDRLPPRQREVVDLRIAHGLDHGEIASLLGIREDASRANYYQAMRRLRERLGAFDDMERER